ncbi:major facilitator superfamily domain-containing protein 1 [Condylostylus longicornis]|uniref:major facilitator superfamily domain-containing protein 1 n=1 Tax=Condylostylus longicornis TaxID=2530218 RepID=UPI00244DBFD3|nr:major facilitator superfamily domain-containing protein 1 [Condylostylus longicornis]XP_055371877.1 major facilitator superfamily domain-containing protein 1 [Condylostylus longicornis]
MPQNEDTEPIINEEDGPNYDAPVNYHQTDNELDPELTGCGATACCNPFSKVHRFIALIFMCLLGFGSYFCYDNPGALQDHFKEDLSLSTTQFTLLYSIYSWPNVILCFIGGFLIDRVFGIRLGTIIYLFILLIGQFLFAFGALLNAFWLMVVGRFVFGIGAESLAVAQNNYAVLWFKGKELNMVFGLQLSFARVGSTVNFAVMEHVYKYVSQFYEGYKCTGVVLLLASATCVMSFICALILGLMDKRAQRITRRIDNPSGETAKLSDIFTFKLTFWMVSIICVAYYVAIFPFIALGKAFFIEKWHFKPEDANSCNSIIYIISAITSPLFGLLIDKCGRNVYWILFATIATIGSHSLLAFTMLSPYVGMVLMGFSYALLASSLWPLVAIIIPEYQLGSAYGICQSVQNLGLAVISIISGMIIDRTNSNYLYLELFFIGWLLISLTATIVILIYDKSKKGNLNLSPRQRQEYNDKLMAIAENNMAGSSSVDELNPSDVGVSRRQVRQTVDDGTGSDREPLLRE